MKKIIVLLIGLLVSTISFSQSKSQDAQRDSILNEINEKLMVLEYPFSDIGRYKLYPTENIHILLKLDTATGVLKLLQWNLKESGEFEVFLNEKDLSYGMHIKGRYELYPTKNMFQFILIDTLLGATWHVQWGTKKEEQWIRFISR